MTNIPHFITPFSEKPTHFVKELGISFDEITPGESHLSLKIRDEHLNLSGTVHGGVTFSLVDTSMGMALFRMLDKDQICVTAEIKIHYLAPVAGGTIYANGEVLNRGRRLGILECHVRDDQQQLVAIGLGTFTILKWSADAQR